MLLSQGPVLLVPSGRTGCPVALLSPRAAASLGFHAPASRCPFTSFARRCSSQDSASFVRLPQRLTYFSAFCGKGTARQHTLRPPEPAAKPGAGKGRPRRGGRRCTPLSGERLRGQPPTARTAPPAPAPRGQRARPQRRPGSGANGAGRAARPLPPPARPREGVGQRRCGNMRACALRPPTLGTRVRLGGCARVCVCGGEVGKLAR